MSKHPMLLPAIMAFVAAALSGQVGALSVISDNSPIAPMQKLVFDVLLPGIFVGLVIPIFGELGIALINAALWFAITWGVCRLYLKFVNKDPKVPEN